MLSKGKSSTPYEFGVKVGIAATLQHNLIVGAKTFVGNPFDGHTLREQLEQAAILMQDTGVRPTTAYVDLGYRGVDGDNPDIHRAPGQVQDAHGAGESCSNGARRSSRSSGT
jgi:IS5 family transposase